MKAKVIVTALNQSINQSIIYLSYDIHTK